MVVIITVNSIAFMKQPSSGRYLAKLFFTNNFVNVQEIFCSASKKHSESFQKIQKKIPVVKSYFSKVVGFYRDSHLRCSVKNGVLRKVYAKFTVKHVCQRLFLIKGRKKETSAQVFSCEFCKISTNTFFYRTPLDNCFCFQLFHATLIKWVLPTMF